MTETTINPVEAAFEVLYKYRGVWKSTRALSKEADAPLGNILFRLQAIAYLDIGKKRIDGETVWQWKNADMALADKYLERVKNHAAAKTRKQAAQEPAIPSLSSTAQDALHSLSAVLNENKRLREMLIEIRTLIDQALI